MISILVSVRRGTTRSVAAPASRQDYRIAMRSVRVGCVVLLLILGGCAPGPSPATNAQADSPARYRSGEPIRFHVSGLICYSEEYNGALEYGVTDDSGQDLLLVRPLGALAQGEQLVSWAEVVDRDYTWNQQHFVQTGEKDLGSVVDPIFEQRPVPPGRYQIYVNEPTQGPGSKLSKLGERVSLGTSMYDAKPQVRVVRAIEIAPP